MSVQIVYDELCSSKSVFRLSEIASAGVHSYTVIVVGLLQWWP